MNLLDHPLCTAKPEYLSGHSTWIGHIPFAFALVSALKPRVIVELGTEWGDSYCAFCQAVAALRLDTRCHALDTWEGDAHGGLYGDEVLETLRAHHDPRYEGFSTLLRSTFDAARPGFADGSVDLLHVDGCHRYEAVAHDVSTWLPVLSERGVLLLHDSAVRDRDCGVWRLVEELRASYPVFEFTHSAGLALVAVGARVPEELLQLCRASDPVQANARSFFSGAADFVAAQIRIRSLEQEIEKRDARALEQRNEIELARQQRDHLSEVVEKSLSWRITSPLRAAHAVLQRGRAVLRSLPSRPEDIAALLVRRLAWHLPQRSSLRKRIVHRRQPLSDSPVRVVWVRPQDGPDAPPWLLGPIEGVVCRAAPPDAALVNLARDADLAILSAGDGNTNLRAFADECRRLGRPLLFRADDAALVAASERERTEGVTKTASVAKLLGPLLEECDVVAASTPALCRALAAAGKECLVVPDALESDPGPRRREPAAADAGLTGGVKTFRVAVFPGLRGSASEPVPWAAALAAMLREHPQLEVHLLDAESPAALEPFTARVHTHPGLTTGIKAKLLAGMDVALVPRRPDDPLERCQGELPVAESAAAGLPTIASPTPPLRAIVWHGHNGFLAATEEQWRTALGQLLEDPQLAWRLGERARDQIAGRYSMESIRREAATLLTAAARGTLRARAPLPADQEPPHDRPAVSVVAVLYNKAGELRYFLESLARQDFPLPFEVVLVDDASPDESVQVAGDFASWHAASGTEQRLTLRILKNGENLGNCGSRNRGIKEALGGIVAIVDADCMLNAGFLSSVFRAFARGDCDVTIGPFNIETDEENPLAVLARHEIDRSLTAAAHLPQDPMVPASFVNCITRNFAIRRAFLPRVPGGVLFDEQFSYSARPESGFGWEDVDMGYRLYRARARIKYLEETFSIHVTHPSSAAERDKPLRSLRNFRRLHQKHVSLHLEARQWSIQTHAAILKWARHQGHDLADNADHAYLDEIFRRYRVAPIRARHRRKLRILTYRWHCAHQFELFRSGHDFSLVRGAGTGMCDEWWWQQRPLPRNARFVERDDIRVDDYDVMILPFDENVLHPELCNSVLSPEWGRTFRWLQANVPLPAVAICHGTPQFFGQYDASYRKSNLGQPIEWSRLELVQLLKDTLVVCNSYQAQDEWQFSKSRVIWHGFSPSDWPPGEHDRWLLAIRREAIRHRPHYNGLFVNDAVVERLAGTIPFDYLQVPDPAAAYQAQTNDWAIAKFQNYVRQVGRYRIYLNPTARSPMPRSRGEAMMSGVATVSLRNHDVDLFIRNGVNGFFADTPDELAEQLLYLYRNPGFCERVQRASRRTAVDVFNLDRYLAAWADVLHQAAG